MTVAELEKRIRNRLRDTVGADDEKFWSSEELIDDYANQVRADLFQIAKCLLIDSTTETDNDTLPLATLTIVADQFLYQISPKILQTLRFQLASQTYPIEPRTQSELDKLVPNWRGLTSSVSTPPYVYCTDYQTDSVFLVPPPYDYDTANLTNSIFPLTDLTIESPDDDLGFRSEYHKDLIPGILAVAFGKQDVEAYRPDLVTRYEAEFGARASQIMLEMYRRTRGVRANPPTSAFRS